MRSSARFPTSLRTKSKPFTPLGVTTGGASKRPAIGRHSQRRCERRWSILPRPRFKHPVWARPSLSAELATQNLTPALSEAAG
jgi:hypothetical protein